MLVLGAEVALEAGARLGEGPVWDDREATLVWVDIASCLLHRFDPASGTDRSVRLPSTVGSVGLCDDGSTILALRDGFGLLHPAAEGEHQDHAGDVFWCSPDVTGRRTRRFGTDLVRRTARTEV